MARGIADLVAMHNSTPSVHVPGKHRMSTPTRLFEPFKLGPITLPNRFVMAPLTRSRSEQPGDVPGKLMLEYYTQRASDGGLIISEATTISITGRGWFGAPGLVL